MKTISIIAITFAILAIGQTSEAAEPQQSSRCMALPPLCSYGQRPLCVCENDYSFNCMWMCASAR